MKKILLFFVFLIILFLGCNKKDIPTIDTYSVIVRVTDDENKIITANIYKNGNLLSDDDIGNSIVWLIYNIHATYSELSNTKIKITSFGPYATSLEVGCIYQTISSNKVIINK